MDILNVLQSSGMPIGIGIGIALMLLTGSHSTRGDERQSSSASGAGGLIWCAFVLVVVVGGAGLDRGSVSRVLGLAPGAYDRADDEARAMPVRPHGGRRR